MPLFSRIFKYKIEGSTASYIINTTYVIILGLILRPILHPILRQPAAGKEFFCVKSTLSLETALFFTMLVFYFLFDWFSTNVFIQEISRFTRVNQESQSIDANSNNTRMINHLFLLLLIILTILLGLIIISSINEGALKYLLFGGYGILIPFGDWIFGIGRRLQIFKAKHILLYKTAFIYTRLMCAFVMSIIAFFHLVINPGKPPENIYVITILLTIFILIIKIGRYFFLVSFLTTERT